MAVRSEANIIFFGLTNICYFSSVALVESQYPTSKAATKPKAKESLPKSFKKPLSNGPNRPGGSNKLGNINKPGNSSQTKTTAEKRKPAQSPRLNRHPGPKPEVW